MIRVYAIILTAVFAFILVKPVIPYLDYMIRKDLIIEKFCVNKAKPEMHCNGKCHLEKRVKKEIDDSQDHSPFRLQNKKEEAIKYLPSEKAEQKLLLVRKLIKTVYQKSYSFEYMPSIFHPPM